MILSEAVVKEFSAESRGTRKLLERLPEARLSWKPHDKSMTLARLATHIAEIPQWAASIVDQDEFDLGASDYTPVILETRDEILQSFDRNAELFTETVKDKDDGILLARWKLKYGDRVLMDMPRLAALRSVVICHAIHHRGQLSVYLRLNDVPLPPLYGPTADEGSF